MYSVFQVNTVYQLLIAINMKIHNIPDNTTDMIISDHTPALINYIPNLKNSGLFRNIFYVKSLEFNSFFWGLPNEAKANAFHQCGANLRRVVSQPQIDYTAYSQMYVANLDAYTKFLHKQYPQMQLYQIEDGAAVCALDWKTIQKQWDYIEGFNLVYDDIKKLYLYSPELMGFEYPAPMVKLPIIEQSPEIIKLFNTIFEYHPIQFPRFIFIEQSYQADNLQNDDLAFFQAVFDIVGYENLYIKPHPRNTINRPFAYGLSKQMNDSIPFELMLLNQYHNDQDQDNHVYITVDSGSLISSRVIFEKDSKSIFLYKAISGTIRTHGSKEFTAYMDKFVEKYASPNLFVPGSLEEFRCIVQHLL